jgi:hypothetical protein
MTEILCRQINGHFGQVSTCFATNIKCILVFQREREQVDELGMIWTQTEEHNKSENSRSALGALYDTTPQQ